MSAWPLVLENDDGIRPAGPPDECFYCFQKVGQSHGPECVIVEKLVEYKVDVQLSDGAKFTGLWQCEVPHSWDEHMMDFRKNESSWCSNNIMYEESKGSVIWDGGEDRWPALKVAHADENRCCLCEAVSFKFMRVVDSQPRRDLKEKS